MKVFISWSGEKSKAVAIALHEWIPDIIQQVEPWMSKADIDAGARWNRDIENNLQDSKFGIICLTKDNCNAPWILFEAGALAKTIEGTYVCPYLIDMESSDIPQGPLINFQGKHANKDETLELLMTINKALKDDAIEEGRLHRLFEKCWPELGKKLQEMPDVQAEQTEERSEKEMIKEVLEVVRQLSRDRQNEIVWLDATSIVSDEQNKFANDFICPRKVVRSLRGASSKPTESVFEKK